MRIDFTPRARKDYQSLPEPARKQAKKQLSFLIDDLRHPSLNAKKYEEGGEGAWQARVNRDYRFYFLIEEDTYVIPRIIPHPQ
jgi:mRNA-degrading endonuclease RelE of RelBE toxin-antitoxin system